MIHGDPKPIDKAAVVQAFVPDTTCAWVVVYASACPTCEVAGIDEEKHDCLYLVPMVGWIHVVGDGAEMRPAIMTSDGVVSDYLDLPDSFKFVAVLQDHEDTLEMAQAIYRKRFGDDRVLVDNEEPLSSLPN